MRPRARPPCAATAAGGSDAASPSGGAAEDSADGAASDASAEDSADMGADGEEALDEGEDGTSEVFLLCDACYRGKDRQMRALGIQPRQQLHSVRSRVCRRCPAGPAGAAAPVTCEHAHRL